MAVDERAEAAAAGHPEIRVIRGAPGDEELAAVMAVLLSATGSRTGPATGGDGPPAPAWCGRPVYGPPTAWAAAWCARPPTSRAASRIRGWAGA